MTLTVTLAPSVEAWIAAAVARGEFLSAEEAAAYLLECGIGALALDAAVEEEDEADIARIRGLLDEARDAVARGEVFSAEESIARMKARLTSPRS